MLWRPIEKLYRKASAFRDHQENEPLSATTSPKPAMSGQKPLPQMGVAYPVSTDPSAPPFPPAHSQVPPPQSTSTGTRSQLNHNGLPHGGMPTSGLPMDFDFLNVNLNASTTGPPQNSNINTTTNDNDLMGIGFNMDLDSDLDLRNGDISWMDFERILEDMNAPVGGEGQAGLDAMGAVNLGDMQWPANVPAGGNWPCNLHGEMG